MIKFFGSKDERPHPSDLVGKLIGREGVMLFRGYSLPLLVTGVSGKRLVAKACVFTDDVIQPIDLWTEEVQVSLKKVAYVCDTLEEAALIRQATRNSMAAYDRSRRELKAEMNSFFSEIASPDSNFDDIAEDDGQTDSDGFYDSADKPEI